MKQARGESVEFNFYFADLPEPEPFRRVVEALLAAGAKLSGEGLAAQGEKINGQPFADTFEPEPGRIEINNEADFLEILTDPDRRLIEVTMSGAVFPLQNLAERVTYLSIPEKAGFSNSHPIAVWSAWEIFGGVPEEYFEPKSKANKHRQLARQKGREVYRRFVALLAKLQPAYAALTLEGFLACPVHLRAEPTATLFRNFYLSNTYFTSQDLAGVRELYNEAYLEDLPGGLYVSTYPYFNPAGKELDYSKIKESSCQVGQLIGQRKGNPIYLFLERSIFQWKKFDFHYSDRVVIIKTEFEPANFKKQGRFLKITRLTKGF